MLKGEGLLASFASVTRIIKKFKLTGSVTDLARSGRHSKLSEEARAFIDEQVTNDHYVDDKWSDQVWSHCMFLHSPKSTQAAWLDFTPDSLLSAYQKCQQGEEIRVHTQAVQMVSSAN